MFVSVASVVKSLAVLIRYGSLCVPEPVKFESAAEAVMLIGNIDNSIARLIKPEMIFLFIFFSPFLFFRQLCSLHNNHIIILKGI